MTDWLIYRENRVPYYQRLYQRDDGKRIWWKVRIPRLSLEGVGSRA